MRPRRPKQYCLQLDIALWCKNQIEHSIWEVVGSSIEELVSSLLNDFAVSVIGVCHVIPRGDSFTHWAEFLQRAKILNNYVRVVLDPFPTFSVGPIKIFLVRIRIYI